MAVGARQVVAVEPDAEQAEHGHRQAEAADGLEVPAQRNQRRHGRVEDGHLVGVHQAVIAGMGVEGTGRHQRGPDPVEGGESAPQRGALPVVEQVLFGHGHVGYSFGSAREPPVTRAKRPARRSNSAAKSR